MFVLCVVLLRLLEAEECCLLLLEQLHHPLIDSPLYGIHHKCPYTTYAQATEEDACAFCFIGMSSNLY
jgi:hypothetical protein